jgi:predicted unusual protein kinase regulating ubiquinone biosynthesis (AarF/ABC1/UbiB family)
VKLLRPGIGEVIAQDLAVLHVLANSPGARSAESRRLRAAGSWSRIRGHHRNELDLRARRAPRAMPARNFRRRAPAHRAGGVLRLVQPGGVMVIAAHRRHPG